jgi:hypothetical protein
MSYIFKLVCGNETLQLHGTDDTAYKVANEDVRFTAGEMRIPIIINRAGGNAVATAQRLDRDIRRYMQLAVAWDKNRQGKPVDLVCKIDDGLGDIEPLYGRGHMRLRVLNGRSNLGIVVSQIMAKGIIRAELTLYTRPFYHGKLADVADATGWVREVADKGLEVWEATTNLLVNPCLAFPTDWDQRWAAYNATDLTVAQSTQNWRSLGSAAKLTASATLPGVFTDDIVLTNAAHVLSAYVYKEGAVPTTADCELWAGHVFENFSTAAAAPTAPLAESTGGGGAVTIAGGECYINTTGAIADTAILLYNTAFDVDKVFRIRTRFRVPTMTNLGQPVSVLSDIAAAPAIGAMGTFEITVTQQAGGQFQITYWDNAAAAKYWSGAAWQAGAITCYNGVVGTTYRVDTISDGTSWYIVLRDANDAALTTTTAVTWALTRAIANNLWWWCGDQNAAAYQSAHYVDYVKIDVGALTTTFSAEDSEHPDWYRATAAAFTMPSTTVNCGVEVKAGRYVYCDDFQVEAKSYATPFANGDLLGCAWTGTAHDSTSTRTAGQCKLNNRNLYADHGAISGWWEPGLAAATMGNAYLFDIRGADDNNRLALYFATADNTLRFYVNGADRCTSAVQTFAAGDKIHWKVRWDFTTPSYALQLNGGTETTASTALTAPVLSTNTLYRGSDYAGANQMDGRLYDVRIWGDALTQAQGLLVYTAGRGLGESPWLWTAAADGIINNCEDSTYVGSAWIGGVPGDIPAGMKLWVDPTPGEDAPAFTAAQAIAELYLAVKCLDKGEYQFKYPYVVEAESMTWPAAGEATVADADHSSGNYETAVNSDDPYGYICTTSADLFRLHGRWRVYARAACTGAGTADWNIGIALLQIKDNQFAYVRRFTQQNVAANATTDAYNWLDLGVIDIPPASVQDAVLAPLFPIYGTSAYLRIVLDVNEAAAAETFRMDCLELLPDESLLYVSTLTDISYVYYPVLVDSTDTPRVVVVYKQGVDEFLALCAPRGTMPMPDPRHISRIVPRKTYAGIIAATGGTRATMDLQAQLEPRFEALR